MSVTQNYTITMSKDALIAITGAILTSIRDDRRDLGAFALMPTWRHFAENEMALKAEALVALNAATALTREDTHDQPEEAACQLHKITQY